jgi:DNA adenine methylase
MSTKPIAVDLQGFRCVGTDDLPEAFEVSAVVKPTRPLLRYFGGKWQLRNWIIQHFPEHVFYVEPFAGAASVLLAKTPAPGGEILNDLNANLINLFRVMQNESQAKELKRRLDWTPYSKAELVISRRRTKEPVERARRLIIRSFMGIEVAGLKGTASGFRMGNVDLRRLDQGGKLTFRNCATDWDNWREHLEILRKRLAKVMIYSRDAFEFIQMMDAPECLQYIDPPYHPTTRAHAGNGTRYAVEFGSAEHERLVETLIGCKSKIALSGYPHPSYAPLEKAGWRRVEKDYRANMSERRRTECLWMNFAAERTNITPGLL